MEIKKLTVFILLFSLLISVSPLYAPQPITAPIVKPFNDGKEWILMKSQEYLIGNSQWRINVPAGFVTDFASVPRLFWSTISPVDKHGRGAIIHDFLYWEQRCTREQADRILVLAMKESQVNAGIRWQVYSAVRIGGANAWAMNANRRAQGYPRIIPSEFLDIPALATWPEYQRMLFARGIRAEPFVRGASSPDYCRAGDSLDVPGEDD